MEYFRSNCFNKVFKNRGNFALIDLSIIGIACPNIDTLTGLIIVYEYGTLVSFIILKFFFMDAPLQEHESC